MTANETSAQNEATRSAALVDAASGLALVRVTITVSRKWEWDPKTDTVSFEGKTKEGKEVKVTYQRSQLSSQSDDVKMVDPVFFNDQYWLLFPLHVAGTKALKSPTRACRNCRWGMEPRRR
jgi:hypothetical protein